MRLRAGICLIFILLLISMAMMASGLKRFVKTSKPVNEEEIESIDYVRDGIRAAYPRLAPVSGNESLIRLNDLILKDFNKILQIYEFNPLAGVEQAPADEARVPTVLNITYRVTLNNPMYTSIYYLASYNSPFAAHPTDLVYTTNIDRAKERRIVLSDIIKIDMDFVNNFRSWKLVNDEQYPDYIKQGIKDYISAVSNEDLLSGMMAADIIGSGNLLGIFTYLTDDSLVISIGLPNYLGDHAEYEMDYSSLRPYLNPDFYQNFMQALRETAGL